MKSDTDRCAEYEKFKQIDAAFRAGDLAALSCSRPVPGSAGRPDVLEVLRLLLSFGADPAQRGINDYTALHMAVAERNLPAVALLLDAGADPHPRTRIDDCETPREMAQKAGLDEIAALLARTETQKGDSWTRNSSFPG
ncbi:MAG: ankyrin repeat domain-containing protein [Burkholderiales bacterium]